MSVEITFHFELRPVEQIGPWTNADGSNPHLSWFGLTDGWYWVDINGVELFRYSDAARKKWGEEPGELPYAAYPVVRFWEDLLTLTNYALIPVPDTLAASVRKGKVWQDFVDQAFDAVHFLEDDGSEGSPSDILETASYWWHDRELSYGHLGFVPRIWLWCVGETMYLRWDNRGSHADTVPMQDAPDWGEVSLPVTDFLHSIGDFHARFVRAMVYRVAAIEREWNRPAIALDVAHLKTEQEQRATWFDPDNAKTREALLQTDWGKVEVALEALK